jgi:type III restriction enzyme
MRACADHPECQPDFVADANSFIYMLESKMRTELTADDVIAKRDAAAKWCKQASDHAKTYKGKPWKYLLIPHDVIAENMTLEHLAAQYAAN